MAAGGADLETAFKDFCDKGNEITTANLNKLMKKAGCFGKNCTSNSTDIAFMKVKEDKKKKTINFKEFQKYIDEMAPSYAKDQKTDQRGATADMIAKLSQARNVPEGTKISKTGGVDRMTDTSIYTGAHKERFDESGQGKGIAGRADLTNNDGYVGGYKGKDTFDKTHK